jgi:hypothetical protein
MSGEPGNGDRTIDEQLVAYLDGELDAKASSRIEQRLATDPVFRRRLQALDHTWEMLDELSSSEVQEHFTQTTLEMVTAAAAEEAKQTGAETAWSRHRRWLLGVGSLLATALAGFLAMTLLAPDRNRQLVEDLPVLEHLDEYRQVGDISFLRMLADEKLFAATGAGGPPPKADYQHIEQMSPEERCAWIEKLSSDEKQDLRQRQERFARLDSAERQRLEQLHEQLLGSDPELRQVMHGYHRWLGSLPPGAREELRWWDPAERVKRIKQLHQQQAVRPSREDLDAIWQWLRQYVDKHPAEFRERRPPYQRPGLRDPERRRAETIRIVRQQLPRHEFRRPPGMTDEDLARLRNRLSDKTRRLLESKSPDEQWATIVGWLRQAFHDESWRPGSHKMRLPPESEEQIDEFFERLRPEEKQRLLALPADEMRRDLEELYFGGMPPGMGPPPRGHGMGPGGPGPGRHPPHRDEPPMGPPPPGRGPEPRP